MTRGKYMTNRDKFNKMSNAELADILSLTIGADKCKFCCYVKGSCFGKSCFDSIKEWLNSTCADEPENPPADKHVDLQKISEKVCDNVNHPSHYNSNEIDIIDFIEDKGLDYCLGKAVIHISTGQSVKNLQKSIWYINKKIQSLERVGNDK